MDCSNTPYAERHASPSDPGVHLTFGEGEWAQFSRFLNRGAAGAAYDTPTRVGTPLVGHGGGVYVADDAGSYVQGAVYAAGVAMSGSHQIDISPAADRIVVQNGAQHLARVKSTGRFEASLNSGATYSTADWDFTGRGPFHWAITHDGANQNLYINRRLADSDAVALGVPAGNIQIGRAGTSRRVRLHPMQPDVATMYLRDFARRVVYSWQPRDVGEGPAGGIATGAVGDTWNCILGDATLKFVWANEPRLRQRSLALTGINNQAPCRLEFPHTRMPSFGTWRWGTVAKSLAGAPEVYLAQLPRQTCASAGSGCYWGRIAVTGGYWTGTWYRENGAAMLTRINTSAAAALGDIVEAAVSRRVDGTWAMDIGVNGNWACQGVNEAVDVTYLSSNFVGVQPNSGHVLGLVRYQSEMRPGEFPRSDWYAPSLWSLVW